PDPDPSHPAAHSFLRCHRALGVPVNIYEGWSEKDLLDLRARLQRREAVGTVTRASIAGLSVEKAVASGESQTVALKRVQYALWLVGEKKLAAGDADENPYQNPYAATIKRTRTRYV